MLEVIAEPLAPGLVLASSYRLERVVGEGGMGVVWAASELATGRPVALKFLRDGREADTKNRERFIREARAAMAIDHPHVARVNAVLETETGAPFIVMELLRGESLRERLEQHGVLEPADAARILVPVVDAVAAAHANHIVHRDLKPENVFLVDGQHVRVLDFGIAKRLIGAADTVSGSTATNLTSTGAILGTPLYMAPEQIYGEEDVDGRADVWALGIILYECLTGRRPTDADGFGQIVKRITTESFEPLERWRPGLPKILTRLAMRMLIRDRAARPSLAEVRDVLSRVVAAADTGAPLDETSQSTALLPPIVPRSSGATAPPMGTTQSHPTALPPSKPGLGDSAKVAIGVAVVTLVAVLAVAANVFFSRMKAQKGQKAEDEASPSASVGPATPAATPTGSGEGWQEAFKTTDLARDAMMARKGAECLKHLDRHDALFPSEPSTNASSPYLYLRAQCLMLVGRCQEGKTFARKMAEQTRAGTAVDQTVEQEIAEYCEGPDVTEREDIVRAVHKLSYANYGQGAPKPTSAQCKEWHATIVARLPKVKSTGLADPIKTVEDDEGDGPAARCYAKANDCPAALAVLRQRSKKNGIPDGDISPFGVTLAETPCALKP